MSIHRTLLVACFLAAVGCKTAQPENPSFPVDVIGISMGGMVGRYAAIAPEGVPGARQLNVVRLFSLSSPHRGALMAKMTLPHEMMSQVKSDSDFIAWINEADVNRSYELYCYVRLGDDVVGPESAAPTGENPWWLANRETSAARSTAASGPTSRDA